jgi:hypothetical protein
LTYHICRRVSGPSVSNSVNGIASMSDTTSALHFVTPSNRRVYLFFVFIFVFAPPHRPDIDENEQRIFFFWFLPSFVGFLRSWFSPRNATLLRRSSSSRTPRRMC